jgi:integrase
MRWENISFQDQTWYIPETKNGDPQLVPLPDSAISILQNISGDNKGWVFPSVTSASGHLEDPKKAWHRVLENAEIDNLRLHDLRRTLGSWMAATGANQFVIGKSLNHKSQESTAIYARLDIDPVRSAVDVATSVMFATVEK